MLPKHIIRTYRITCSLHVASISAAMVAYVLADLPDCNRPSHPVQWQRPFLIPSEKRREHSDPELASAKESVLQYYRVQCI